MGKNGTFSLLLLIHGHTLRYLQVFFVSSFVCTAPLLYGSKCRNVLSSFLSPGGVTGVSDHKWTGALFLDANSLDSTCSTCKNSSRQWTSAGARRPTNLHEAVRYGCQELYPTFSVMETELRAFYAGIPRSLHIAETLEKQCRGFFFMALHVLLIVLALPQFVFQYCSIASV